VNAIAPGPIADTEGARRLLPGEVGERLRGAIPIRRLGLIEDIAALSLFVLSEAASNINGAILVSDGGQSLCGSFFSSIPTLPHKS
jgi:peroxisomal 2,4-dienoyl-CoA reductase